MRGIGVRSVSRIYRWLRWEGLGRHGRPRVALEGALAGSNLGYRVVDGGEGRRLALRMGRLRIGRLRIPRLLISLRKRLRLWARLGAMRIARGGEIIGILDRRPRVRRHAIFVVSRALVHALTHIAD